MLKAILFDFDQTLVNSADGFRRAEHWLQREIFSRIASSEWEPFITLYRQIRDSGQSDAPAAKTRQWLEVCRQFTTEPDDSTLRTWEAGYWNRVEEGTVMLPDAAELLAALHQRFALGLVTNAGTVGERTLRCEHFPALLNHFGAVVVCGENAVPLKPDPAGFLQALAMLRAAPEQAVFVGDNWATDIQGARAARMLPVWLRHAAIARKAAPVTAEDVPRLDSLEPLARLAPEDTFDTARARLQAS